MHDGAHEKRMRPVGFEPTRFGETVGLKSTPLDHSGRSAVTISQKTVTATQKHGFAPIFV